ncbi:hypothetical protein PGT21_003638 [Puccinia graminis f. sp. tritici]|uniref:Uncharacterized protein n=1 Tax=Puccinia graminis f. sp. tritici TaxID=56615 RepID=A0A5B0MET4_PUCGR|nr:hypothetical protein PGT21_003638 [Puccinia graminis f. sp. tritici]
MRMHLPESSRPLLCGWQAATLASSSSSTTHIYGQPRSLSPAVLDPTTTEDPSRKRPRGKEGQPKLRCDHCRRSSSSIAPCGPISSTPIVPKARNHTCVPTPTAASRLPTPLDCANTNAPTSPTDTLASITTVSITQASRSSNAPSLVGLTSSVTLVIRIRSDVPSRTAVGTRNHSSLFDRSNSICKSIILLPNRTEREKKKKTNQ